MATDIPMVDVAPVDADEELECPSVVERWTAQELFAFKPIQKILWNEKNRTTFWNAEIDGSAFLNDGDVRDYWLRDIQLPAGPSGNLARLAQRIKDFATEAKRIAEEAERDELIKSENSRAVCDPKAIAN